MRDDYGPRGGRACRSPGRGGLRRLVVGGLFSAILIAGGATVCYFYMRGRGEDPVKELSAGLDALARRFERGRGEAAGRKLRDLGRFLEDHGDDIGKYGDEVERRLEDIRAVSEDAYRAAKRKIDEFRRRESGEEPTAE